MNAASVPGPDAAAIRAARERIAPHVRRTPLERSAALSRRFGIDVHLKLECWQPTRSFKVRGAFNAIARLSEARIPYISVLTDPTTGGVSASLAMLGDVNIGEPKALIGFAGARVIQQTVRETLPEGFQRSEFLLDHGALDMIVDRRDMRDRIAGLLAMFMHLPAPSPA